MKQAVQWTKVSRALLHDRPDLNPNILVDLPPETWVVRGPRGGRYLATGSRTRRVGEVGRDFEMNILTVEDRSEGVRYIRPGSRLARQVGAET